MTKYRKKPVVIEARKFPEEKNENVNELSEASHGGGRPTMSDAIEAVRAELESARHALRGAEEAYGADEKARLKAQDRAARSYEGAARNRRNVDRLMKALELLEGEE